MIAQHYKDMLGSKSVIRQISEWSTARGAETPSPLRWSTPPPRR